jgi:hypothetical protein
MTRKADWHEPDAVPARPYWLAPTLTVLAQFDSEDTPLDHADIARLSGCSDPIAKRCLATLSELGYLTRATDGTYQLTSKEFDPMRAGRDEDGTLDMPA